MTTVPSSGARKRSLHDDLLEDLRQAPARTAVPHPGAGFASLEEAPARALHGTPTPAIEVSITPRSWSSVGWTRNPGEDGLRVSLGPVHLSLGRRSY
jgi:hypothetical protein